MLCLKCGNKMEIFMEVAGYHQCDRCERDGQKHQMEMDKFFDDTETEVGECPYAGTDVDEPYDYFE